MKKLLLALLTATLVPSALAASPWDGTWNLNRAKSHLTGDSFTYTKTASGMWHVTFGDLGFDFLPDGKPYPVLDADHTQVATMKGDHELDYSSQFKGKTTSSTREILSADGATITDETTGTRADGSPFTTTSTSKRSGAGTGFVGKWVSTKVDSNARSIVIISTAADGSMSWNLPASKEMVTSKMDGTPSPITGPQVPVGVVITYKKVSARHLTYAVTFNGKPVGEGSDELSADGKTLEETNWAAGKMDEKTTSIYDKQ